MDDTVEVKGELDYIPATTDWKSKLLSRKFLISLAAFLMSIGTGITGLANGDKYLAIGGGICCVISSAIYSACEAWVDANRELANGMQVQVLQEDIPQPKHFASEE